ncbi:chloride transport protein 6-like isoform X2 [Actinia tenebrosa]|uniref:Chloride channel protein n=1 Tax=Actinia tenebrosa TaxID=6105 RepID=A0A6P8HP63_ACTTE|nr:chloride transport protein 6-like isoform X2 [Actinia tenebrosa]
MASINDIDRKDYQEMGMEMKKTLHSQQKKELPRKDYESLDYDVCYNHPFSEMMKSKETMPLVHQNLMRWIVTFIIGVLTGLVAVFIDFFVRHLTNWKFSVIETSIKHCTPAGCLIITLLIMLLFNVGFTMIASALTIIEPVAAGSGIPEIKCYLNGIKVPHVVRLKTLISKAVGVLFSVAGGLFVGKEGPMIHSGAIIGAGVPQFQSIAFRRIKFNFPYFRTDRDKRDFVSGGAAAGVAAAFGAPIGGVLFSLEEGSSFWNQSLTWRTCNKKGGEKCDLWNIQDLLIFIVMGFVGGLLGAWFNALNKDLTKHRILHVNSKSKIVRLLEAVLVALGTTCIAFFCPIYLGTCKKLPQVTHSLNETKNYFCSEGEYNDMATLFFNSQEGAIKQLFHLDGAFSLTSLGIFFTCFYFLACWTYGASVPSGLFVPCLLCGASYGRFVGELLRSYANYDHTYHGTFALIGAASFLGGVVRMTISLTVILIESTNEISYGLPIMITLMVAKWSGDLFNEGLYDIHIKLKSIPLLEWSAPLEMYKLKAQHIMESCLSYLYPHTRVHSIIGILKTTAHNAFPVVTVDKALPLTPKDYDYPGNPISSNEEYARSKTMSFVLSEQRVRSATQEDPHEGEDLGQVESTVRLLPRQPQRHDCTDRYSSNSSIHSASAPSESFMKHARPRHNFNFGGIEEEASNSMDIDEHSEDSHHNQITSSSVNVTADMSTSGEQQLITLHGIILRSQLVTLLKKKIFYLEAEGSSSQPQVNFSGMTEDYPRFPDIYTIPLSRRDREKIVDVTPYMNPCPYVVFPWTPVPLVFNLFRTMGLRHLPVVNNKGQLVGIITRANLTHEYMEQCLENLENSHEH